MTVDDTGLSGEDVLDFSGVSEGLTVTILTDGGVTVTDGTNTLTSGSTFEKIISGSRAQPVMAF